MSTQIGKIKSVWFGYGGYQDAQFGVTFELGGKGWGCGDFWGMWAHHDKHCKWTVQDQKISWGEMTIKLVKLMEEANVSEFSGLAGKPVEVTFKDNTLVKWRILTECV